MNTDLLCFEDFVFIYSLFSLGDIKTLGFEKDKLPWMGLMPKWQRWDLIHNRANRLSGCCIPIDVSKFDNSIPLDI